MKKHPLYYWLNNGNEISLGIDGSTYLLGHLSEWTLWTMLCAPETEDFSVEKIKKLVLFKQDNLDILNKAA